MEDKIHILIVDDEANIREGLKEVLSANLNYEVSAAASGQEALEMFNQHKSHIVLTDLKLGGRINGIEVLTKVKEIDADVQVIVFTAYGTIEGAVEAMKKGAYDYIPKPLDIKQLRNIVANAVAQRYQQLKYDENEECLVGTSLVMREIYRIIDQVAPTDATILIYGESGTGKELVARAIHQKSQRKSKSFVCLNCGAIPSSLFSSELFGHEKGAFTGAFSEKKGVFEEAEGGTLFLDEVSEIPTEHQATFLRVLQEKEITRLGTTVPRKVDVRILASTNKNIEDLVQEKKFREDLYYRLNVIRINLPPLCERHGDIPFLIQYFLKRETKRLGSEPKSITPDAQVVLENYKWPGNVRQLKNTLERAFILTTTPQITINELSTEIHMQTKEPQPGYYLKERIKQAEKEALLGALRQTNFRRRDTAKLLGISLRKLQYMIKEHNIKDE